MQVLKNIAIIIITLIFFISSNGFIFEKYLCFSCDSTNSDITFFEFGEISHNHNKCASNSHCTTGNQSDDCCCGNTEEHKENTDLTYYSLDIIYQKNHDVSLKQIYDDINDNFSFDILKYLDIKIQKDNNKVLSLLRQLKIPPIIKQYKSSLSFCSILSVFRL